MRYLGFIAGCIFLSSCYSQHRAQRQLIKVQTLYPASVASLCGDLYPPVEYVKDSFVYLPGKELPAAIQYVQVDCDSVKGNNRVVALACPPCRQYTPDTIAISRHTQAVNTAKEKELQYAIDELSQRLSDCQTKLELKSSDLKKVQQEKSSLQTWLIVIIAYLVVKTVLRIGFPGWSFITRWLI